MTQPDPNVRADDLLKTSKTGAIELHDDALDQVAGGVTVNKSKTADKAAAAADAYIRG